MLLVTRKQVSHLVFSPSPKLEDTAEGIQGGSNRGLADAGGRSDLKFKLRPD
jgi:hypothetical protein